MNTIRKFPLGELGTYINGRAFKPSEWVQTAGLPIVRIANLTDHGAIFDYFDGTVDEKHFINNGDIVVSWSATLDAFIWNRGPAALNQHIFKVIPNSNLVVKEYLYFVLKKAMRGLSELVHGATMKHVTKPVFEGFEVPIFRSKEKQRRIAAQLKAQLAEVDKARQAAEVQLQDVENFISRYRKNALAGLRSMPRIPLGELLLGIEAGKSFKTTELPPRDHEFGILKVSAVSWNQFQPQEAKAVEGDYQPEEKHRVKQGDLIISRANTIELVGAVVRVEQDYPFRLLSDKTLRLVVDEKQILPDYLLTVLQWPEARVHIEHNATGTSDSMRNISQKTIKSIPIPLINKSRQRDIIEHSMAINKQVRRIETASKASLSDLNVLPQKILAQAFEQ